MDQCKWPWVKGYPRSNTKVMPHREANWNSFITIRVKTLEKTPNILQPYLCCHIRINTSPSNGSKDLCFFAHIEKESGKAHGKGTAKGGPDPATQLDALWENSRTTLQQKQSSRCLQVDFRAMTKSGNPLVGLRKKGKAFGCSWKSASSPLIKSSLKAPKKI